MIKVYADDTLVYDSRLDDYRLLGLTVDVGVSIGGTANLVLPPGHPAYNAFTHYKTVVTVERDDVLLFRGRSLYPQDDFYNRRTIVCEGERCFLRDGVMRPYLYQDDPAVIFADVITLYNAQVDSFKQFVVGTVTVTDANNYIRLESTEAEQTADTIDKLVERCGGYIVFTTNSDGQRVINWYAELNYASSQVIEFGGNLLDFARDGANTDLATVIIPYGAKDETTGERIDITSVTEGGVDFIQDYDAVALRGVIARPVYWDDVTIPANLLTKAQQYLEQSKRMVMSLELSAVDLSDMDKDIDSFRVGDKVTVRSKPHGIIDEVFQLTERKYDLLTPGLDSIVLGKDVATLTGADAAGDRETANALNRVERIIKADYQLNTAKAIEASEQTLTSLIEQTETRIKTEVSEQYVTGDQLDSKLSTTMEQTAEAFTFSFESLQKTVDENDAEARAQYEEIRKYIRFEDGNIILGEEGNEITLRIENDRISFLDGGAEVAYINNKQLYITDAHFLNSLRLGSFAWLPRENGNLSLVKVGG